MNVSCLRDHLTDDERQIFNETGMLTVENALSPERVKSLTAASDRLYGEKVAVGHDPTKALFYPDFIRHDPLFLDLVDEGKILPKVWGILGWNIYLYHAHMIVTPPTGKSRDDKTFGWHQDSGRVNKEIESHPRPSLSLKVAYFLSDVSVEGRGNFWVVPGTQVSDTLEMPPNGVGQPKG